MGTMSDKGDRRGTMASLPEQKVGTTHRSRIQSASSRRMSLLAFCLEIITSNPDPLALSAWQMPRAQTLRSVSLRGTDHMGRQRDGATDPKVVDVGDAACAVDRKLTAVDLGHLGSDLEARAHANPHV